MTDDLAKQGAGLAALVLRCGDLEASAGFYRSLGLKLIEEKHGEGPRHYSIDLDGLLLELYPATSPVTGPQDRLSLRLPRAAELLTDPDGRRVEVLPLDR